MKKIINYPKRGNENVKVNAAFTFSPVLNGLGIENELCKKS